MPKTADFDKAKVIDTTEILIPEGWMIVNIKTKQDFLKLAKNYDEILKHDNLYYLLSDASIIFVYKEE